MKINHKHIKPTFKCVKISENETLNNRKKLVNDYSKKMISHHYLDK